MVDPEVKMAVVAGLVFGGGAAKIYDPYVHSFLISWDNDKTFFSSFYEDLIPILFIDTLRHK